MKVLITGASGLVGHPLVLRLREKGHDVVRLVRADEVPPDGIYWDPQHGRLDPASLGGLDAVVHLAGENIASGRWTESRMQRIRDSRVEGTRLLVARLLESNSVPRVLVCASAVGAYGDRDDELLDEGSSYGTGFLAGVCHEWEAATKPLSDAGTRVVHLRIGVVLSPDGGALAKMLLPFKFCVGGVIGDGDQFMSWIAIEDLGRIIELCLLRDDLEGPVNAVAPNPVTNRDFTKALGKALGRPTVVPLPAFLAKALFGNMADECLLASARVQPKKLQEAGFHFGYPELEQALEHML